MSRNEFQSWLANWLAETGWSREKIRLKGGPAPSRITGWLNGERPGRDNIDRLAAVSGKDADDLWAMVKRSYGSEPGLGGSASIDLRTLSRAQVILLDKSDGLPDRAILAIANMVEEMKREFETREAG